MPQLNNNQVCFIDAFRKNIKTSGFTIHYISFRTSVSPARLLAFYDYEIFLTVIELQEIASLIGCFVLETPVGLFLLHKEYLWEGL